MRVLWQKIAREGAAAVSIETVDRRKPHIAMDLALGVTEDPSHGIQGAAPVELAEDGGIDEEWSDEDESGTVDETNDGGENDRKEYDEAEEDDDDEVVVTMVAGKLATACGENAKSKK